MEKVPEEYRENLKRYFHMYADPETGKINSSGFKAILQCLRMCPTEDFVMCMFKDHEKDPENSYISLEEFIAWMTGNWASNAEIRLLLSNAIKDLYGSEDPETNINGIFISIDDFIMTLKTAGEEPLSDEEASTILNELKKIDSGDKGRITGGELLEFLQGTQSDQPTNNALEQELSDV